MPLLFDMGGRWTTTKTETPISHSGHTTVTETVVYSQLTDFFDLSMSLIYNLSSVEKALTPLTMLFGCYLSVNVHLMIEYDLLAQEEAYGFQSSRLYGLSGHQRGVGEGSLMPSLAPAGDLLEQRKEKCFS